MLWETVAVNAMQFQGYVFDVVHTQVPNLDTYVSNAQPEDSLGRLSSDSTWHVDIFDADGNHVQVAGHLPVISGTSVMVNSIPVMSCHPV